MDGALVKVVLTGLAAAGYWYSLTPPSQVTTKDRLHLDGVFGYIAYNLSISAKASVAGFLFCQMIAIAAIEYPSSFQPSRPLSYICHANNPQHLTSLSLQFLIGSGLAVIMTMLRAWSYHALGALFTFQITIREDHRLITSGPYGYVRHPGYTALIGCIIGVNAVLLDRQSWVRQCDIMRTPVRWVIYTYVLLCIFSITSMLRRGKVEDERLKNEFKEEWLAYSKRVPYKYVPGVF